MKHLNLSLILFVLLLNSCGSTKNTIQNQVNKPKSTEISTNNDVKSTPFSHDTFDVLLKRYVTDEGYVDYKGIKTERAILTQYIKALGENTPNDEWSKNDKLVYWINAYNAMTIDLILRHYPLKTIKDIKDPWKQSLWQLGGTWYDLDHIEHQILRKMNEPRIHFAINCASISCPKLLNEAFNSDTLEHQLTEATKLFLADKERNHLSENEINLSKIFKWFAKDFKQNGSLINFLNNYSNIQVSENAKVNFKDYNWGLNE